MTFDNSPIRAALHFRQVFIRLMGTSRITRQQVIFLSYLIENGFTKDFTVRSVKTRGLSWGLANQYLTKLKRIGYASRLGHLWTISPQGLRYFATFMKEFKKSTEESFRWK